MQPDAQPDPGQLVAFVLPDLRFGGVERLTIDIAEELLNRGLRVDLVLLKRRGEFLAQLPEGVRVVSLGAKRFRHALVPLRRYYRDVRPDMVCAALWPLTVVSVIASLGLRAKPRVIVSEHNSLIAQYRGNVWKNFLLRASAKVSYRFAHGIIGTSNGVSDEIARLARIDRKRVTTVYNPVKVPPCSNARLASLWGSRQGKRIVAVGRLKAQKNFPLLVSAFAKLPPIHNATLAIVGEGEERKKLEAMIGDLGLEGRVVLPGVTLTPGDWYRSADLFVLSSDYEGFALVLVEAMHFGLPVVATDCPHGPAEVLEHGRWGRLVPVGDADALARAMDAALSDTVDSDAQNRRAAEFNVERAASNYLAVQFGDPENGD